MKKKMVVQFRGLDRKVKKKKIKKYWIDDIVFAINYQSKLEER